MAASFYSFPEAVWVEKRVVEAFGVCLAVDGEDVVLLCSQARTVVAGDDQLGHVVSVHEQTAAWRLRKPATSGISEAGARRLAVSTQRGPGVTELCGPTLPRHAGVA